MILKIPKLTHIQQESLNVRILLNPVQVFEAKSKVSLKLSSKYSKIEAKLFLVETAERWYKT
jgi:hypothetical protein